MSNRFTRAVALLAASAMTFFPVSPANAQNSFPTATPIKHLVVIFQENVSFDHYFGTYPNAVNPEGEPSLVPAPARQR